MEHLISIEQFSKQELLTLLEKARSIEGQPPGTILQGKIMATLFFEPSTRTRLSFESAALRLGVQTIGFSDANNSSIYKGESLHDTIKTVESYVDLIVLRHPKDFSAQEMSEIADVPIINAGDGSNEHPTQTLTDLYSILKTQNTLENLSIGFVGDLKYSRTIHSLVKALCLFNCKLFFISEKGFSIPESLKKLIEESGCTYEEKNSIEETLPSLDIIYVNRMQKERFENNEQAQNKFKLKKEMITNVKPNLKILNPLPRIDEMSRSIDSTPYAYYFEQVRNSIYVRQAILLEFLKKK